MGPFFQLFNVHQYFCATKSKFPVELFCENADTESQSRSPLIKFLSYFYSWNFIVTFVLGASLLLLFIEMECLDFCARIYLSLIARIFLNKTTVSHSLFDISMSGHQITPGATQSSTILIHIAVLYINIRL